MNKRLISGGDGAEYFLSLVRQPQADPALRVEGEAGEFSQNLNGDGSGSVHPANIEKGRTK